MDFLRWAAKILLLTALGAGLIFFLNIWGIIDAMGDYSGFFGLFLGCCALLGAFWWEEGL